MEVFKQTVQREKTERERDRGGGRAHWKEGPGHETSQDDRQKERERAIDTKVERER